VPQSVVDSDPRWQWLSQMGSVRAKWNGSALMLLPLTPRFLAMEKAQRIRRCYIKSCSIGVIQLQLKNQGCVVASDRHAEKIETRAA